MKTKLRRFVSVKISDEKLREIVRSICPGERGVLETFDRAGLRDIRDRLRGIVNEIKDCNYYVHYHPVLRYVSVGDRGQRIGPLLHDLAEI